MPRRARRTGAAYVDDERERDITFFKRRNGLFKCASDLSILTGASVAVVIEDQNRSKFHAVGTPTVQAVVDAALSSDVEEAAAEARPVADEQLMERIAPLERELAWLKGEAAEKDETTKASKARFKMAQKKEENEEEGDTKKKKLFFSKPDKLSSDEMNELLAEMLEIKKELNVRLPPLRRRGGKRPIQGSSVPPPPPPPPPPPQPEQQLQLPQWPNLSGPHNQLLPVAPPPFVADQPPPPPPPAEGGSLWIPELPPPPVEGSPWAGLLPLRPPRFAGMETSFLESQQAPPPAQVSTQLAPLPLIREEAPLLQEPFLFADQAPVLAPLPAPLQMPVAETHLPLQAPLLQEPFLFSDHAPTLAPLPSPLQMPVAETHLPLQVQAPFMQEPFLFSDQAPVLAPPPTPLQMPVEAHMPLEAPWIQEPFLMPDQAPVHAPPPTPLLMPVGADHFPLEAPLFQESLIMADQKSVHALPPPPLQMPLEAHLPPAAQEYNQDLAVQQQPQEYENYDYMFENVGLSQAQPVAAGAGDAGFAAIGNDDNPFGYQQLVASPLYDGQIYFGSGVDNMGVPPAGDFGGVPEAALPEVEHASSSGWGNNITGDAGAWF